MDADDQAYLKGVSHRRFLPELVPELVQHIQLVSVQSTGGPEILSFNARDAWYLNQRMIVLKWLYSCCLVCRYWKELFTPALYREIVIDEVWMHLLRRTLWHNRPDHIRLIHALIIRIHSPYPAGLMPFLYPLPNLAIFVIDGFDFSRCPPLFPRISKLLPQICKVDICGHDIHPSLLPNLIRFIQRAKFTQFSCNVKTRFSLLKGHPRSIIASLRIGKCNTRIHIRGGEISLSNTCLKDMSHYLEELQVMTKPGDSDSK